MNVKLLISVLLFSTLLVLNSCKVENLFNQPYPTTDMQTIEDSLIDLQYEYVLKPDDKINLSIWNHDELSIGSVYSIYNANAVYGRWVMLNRAGYATLPKLGKVKLAGLTLSQAKTYLQKAYGKFLVNPIVELNVLNRQVTVLGDVLHPGNFNLEKEQNNLLSIIAEAGGFNFYADKRGVKITRRVADSVRMYKLDLTQMTPYQQENILLKNGDIIYVPAKKAKVTERKVSVIIPISTVISSIILVLSYLKKTP
jgi:polysaccharide export outer membrane protein